MRRIAALMLALAAFPGHLAASSLVEVPYLLSAIQAGNLPPIMERVPAQVDVVNLKAAGKVPGRYGGKLHLLMGKQKDTKMMMVYGYARLIAYDHDLNFVPDLLESFEVKGEREFTLRLRKGHKWSDGHPFTAEDFRYYWEDMANDNSISEKGLPSVLLVEGEGPTFEVLDETTVRYTWSKPNPNFVPWIARPRPLLLYRPAHYLKQFHAKYSDEAMLNVTAVKENKQNWEQIHDDRDRWYRMDNPERPTLQPWYNSVKPPSERFVFKRNPFYHRVDKNGLQLPYVDEVIINLGATNMVPARTGSGEADLQARYLRFDHFTFLKESEARYDFSVRLWQKARGSQIALFPNLNAKDEIWRDLFQDIRFRRALSIAINRAEINQVIYYGLAKESQDTVLQKSPLYKDEYRTAWTEFDLKKANYLLDDMGLTARDDDGIRLLPNGQPIVITVETAGESTEQTDVLELVHDGWRAVGIKLLSKPAQREVFRQRIYSGDTIMSVWSGVSNGIPTAFMSPDEFTPSSKLQFQWPRWGHYVQSGGKSGEAPQLEEARRLIELNEAWTAETNLVAKAKIWHRILKLHADNVFVIGLVNATMQPIVISNKLRNIPAEGVYNWHPGAYFGIYRPATFWFARKGGKIQ
jgi:peptide/nickel transport system substrate-binding protein